MRGVAARLGFDSSNLTGLVDRLEARGLIARHPDPTDRRVKAVALTAEGRRVRDAFWRKTVGDAGGLEALTVQQLTGLRAIPLIRQHDRRRVLPLLDPALVAIDRSNELRFDRVAVRHLDRRRQHVGE